MDLESKYYYFYHSWDFIPYYESFTIPCTGNQYMDKSAENRMHSNLELLPVMNVKK
jgi:hypothetical protein